MNPAYFIPGAAIVLTLIGLLTALVIKRKDATITTLEKQNKWLEHKLNDALENSPDSLAERLSKRIIMLQDELTRLSLDQEKNESLIVSKEKELAKAKEEVTDFLAAH